MSIPLKAVNRSATPRIRLCPRSFLPFCGRLPMAGVARPLTLPRGWPRRIRSAAVHAISLADFALTAALGWAAQSLNPRLRLRAELERLRNEIPLLREEIRIKDSRMT